MPSRNPPSRDHEFGNVYRWDDGAEYIQPNALTPEPEPFIPPHAPKSSKSSRSKTAKYTPSHPPRPLSPADDFRPGYHRGAYDTRDPAPPRRSRRLATSPDRGDPARGHHHHHHHHEASPPPRDRHYRHRGESPPRHRDTRHPPPARHGRPPRPEFEPSEPVSDMGSSRHKHHRRSHSPSSPPRRGPPGRAATWDAPSTKSAAPSGSRSRPSKHGRGGSTLTRSKTAKDMTNGLLGNSRFQKAATAAFQAGAGKAFTLRSTPGSWAGDKGTKVAAAAFGAAALGALEKGGE